MIRFWGWKKVTVDGKRETVNIDITTDDPTRLYGKLEDAQSYNLQMSGEFGKPELERLIPLLNVLPAEPSVLRPVLDMDALETWGLPTPGRIVVTD